ncbi:hypothetical protein Tco_0130366 [Tanacetum coccineum]
MESYRGIRLISRQHLGGSDTSNEHFLHLIDNKTYFRRVLKERSRTTFLPHNTNKSKKLEESIPHVRYMWEPNDVLTSRDVWLIQGTRAKSLDECDSNKPHEQVCLSGGDIYDDPSLLRFYQNDDIPPWGNTRRRTTEEEGLD